VESTLAAQIVPGTGVPVGVGTVVEFDVGAGVAVAVEFCALMATMKVSTKSNTAQNFKLLMTGCR